jgi:GNAT superfamily N-acetyltransferase
MITYRSDVRDVDTYLSLRKQVDWIKLDRKQAQTALENSLLVITAFDGDKPVGMGRIVGDGAVISYIQDLIVIPEYQRQAVGSGIIKRLIEYVDGCTKQGTRMMLCLMCAKGREKFYEKHGFIARPTDSLGPGMIQYIQR